MDSRDAPLVCVWLMAILLVLTGTLAAVHALPAPATDPCYDRLMWEWNRFAEDANKHITTNDAGSHDKTHARLDREWEALHALSCW